MLGDVCSIKARIGWQGLKKSEYMDSGYYSLVSGTDFKNGFIDWGACSFVSEWRYNQDRNIQLRNGDVLVTKDGTIGKVAYVKGMTCPTTLNSGVFVIRPSNDELQPSFLQLIFKSRFFREFLDRITAGSTIVHLYQKDIVEFDFPIPNIAEQCRIAHAIEIIDGHLSKIKHLISKYEAIKKATVNLLLEPKNGWRRVKIEDIFDIKVGGDLDIAYYSKTKTSFYRYEVVSNSLSNRGLYGYTSLPKFPADSITITGRGNVGHAEYRDDQFDAIVRIVVLTPIGAGVCVKFVAELINITSPFQIESTGVPQLTAPQIAAAIISLPPIDEQKRIVATLDTIDNSIKDLKAQLEKSQAIKQGMMAYFFG